MIVPATHPTSERMVRARFTVGSCSGRKLPATALLAATLVVTGCEPGQMNVAPPPADRAQPAAPAPATEIEIPRTEISEDAITAHFARQEAQRLSNGLLRRERSPRDLPFSARDVEEAFVRVALYEEYSFENGRIVERKTPAALRRWQVPVRMRLEFGDLVPSATQRADTSFVRSYAARLGRLSGHPVTLAETRANFHVLVLTEAERRAIGPRLQELVPGIDPVTLGLVRDLPLTVSCLVLAFSRSGTNVYTDAVAVIRAELPDLSRRACYYEELAQGMGLPNDSPRVRPSLFNDTAEFAVLTALDENLLRLLYDDRLRPGMREAEARPIIREIASELMGGES